MKINADIADLLFRLLFCLIFVGLGLEHIFSDSLIRQLMPDWVPYPRMASLLCGIWLVVWGSFIMIGWQVRLAAFALGIFLVVVTVLVHVPGVLGLPEQIPAGSQWMWEILQRSNLVKNLCLLGVCFHLHYHQLGRYSLERYLAARNAP